MNCRNGHCLPRFWKRHRRVPLSLILRFLVGASAALTVSVLIVLIGYIMIKGVPNLSAGLFAVEYTTQNVSLLPALVNTVLITFLSLLIAAPIGVFSAIYLVEYAKKGNRLVAVVRLTAETLSGIPSIVYGLFGLLFFVTKLGWGYSVLAGSFTLAIMVLPIVFQTAEESLKAVPDTYREASFGLGAGKLRTVFRIVLPSAAPGILSGIILSVGRIVGESAALIYTAGTVAEMSNGFFSSGRTLAVHMYALTSEGLYVKQAYGTAVVLLVMVMGMNALSAYAAKKVSKG